MPREVEHRLGALPGYPRGADAAAHFVECAQEGATARISEEERVPGRDAAQALHHRREALGVRDGVAKGDTFGTPVVRSDHDREAQHFAGKGSAAAQGERSEQEDDRSATHRDDSFLSRNVEQASSDGRRGPVPSPFDRDEAARASASVTVFTANGPGEVTR